MSAEEKLKTEMSLLLAKEAVASTVPAVPDPGTGSSVQEKLDYLMGMTGYFVMQFTSIRTGYFQILDAVVSTGLR